MIVGSGSDGVGVRIVLETEEAMLLSELADQVDSVLLLGDGDDPALERLFPNAYPEDAGSASEFTRYTRESLVDGKRQAAQSVRDATAVDGHDRSAEQGATDELDVVGPFSDEAAAAMVDEYLAQGADAASGSNRERVIEIELDQSQAWAWLTFLTDLRLILAERVGVSDDDDDAEDSERTDDYLRAAYEWAGFVQGSMLEILDPMGG